MKMNGIWVILFGSNMEEMEWNHFMTILLLDPYFKIKSWIYMSILGILEEKKSIKSNFIPFHFSQFQGEWKFEILREYRGIGVLSYPFHSLLLKLPNKWMDFPFSPLKLPNKGIEEYSKMILFIPFHSIPFPPLKWGLKEFPYATFSKGNTIWECPKVFNTPT